MSYVIAIDVGIKNLGLCVYDFVTNRIVHWDNVSLVANGRYIPMNNVRYVYDFINRHSALFLNCHTLVIERQMRANMRIIEAVFETLYFGKCKVISPRCVKMHYNLSARNYRANKQKAVEWALEYCLCNPQVVGEFVNRFKQEKTKQDDMADALLLVMYFLDTYSNQLSK